MSDFKELEEAFDRIRSEVRFDTPFSVPEYTTPALDIEIDPDHFINWLKAEGENDKYLDVPHGSYSYMVGNMCEYSCLYVAMLLHGKKLKGDLRIVCGNFGFWEHYWLKYTLDGETYYLDLTLQQFLPEAPKFSISRAIDDRAGYNAEFDTDGETIEDYVERKMAFDFYTNPHSL